MKDAPFKKGDDVLVTVGYTREMWRVEGVLRGACRLRRLKDKKKITVKFEHMEVVPKKRPTPAQIASSKVNGEELPIADLPPIKASNVSDDEETEWLRRGEAMIVKWETRIADNRVKMSEMEQLVAECETEIDSLGSQVRADEKRVTEFRKLLGR